MAAELVEELIEETMADQAGSDQAGSDQAVDDHQMADQGLDPLTDRPETAPSSKGPDRVVGENAEQGHDVADQVESDPQVSDPPVWEEPDPKVHDQAESDQGPIDQVRDPSGRDAPSCPKGPDPAESDRGPLVMGDCAYADGATRALLARLGLQVMAKVPPIHNTSGGFTKDRFVIDLEAKTATCPAGKTVPISFTARGGGRARFDPHCASCPLASSCTSSAKGRTIAIHPQEALLQRARADQQSPEWAEAYRANRPVVERKISHFSRRAWGGRKARVRGLARIQTDVFARAGVLNLARLAVLGLSSTGGAWATA